MKKFKTHQYFWVTSILYIILSVFWFYSDDAIDINVHDTYFVISNFHIGILLAQVFFVIGLIYWLSFKNNFGLINILTKIHLIITIGGVLAYFLGLKLIDAFTPKNDFPLFDDFSNENMFLTFLFVFIIVAQILFVINLILSTFIYVSRK